MGMTIIAGLFFSLLAHAGTTTNITQAQWNSTGTNMTAFLNGLIANTNITKIVLPYYTGGTPSNGTWSSGPLTIARNDITLELGPDVTLFADLNLYPAPPVLATARFINMQSRTNCVVRGSDPNHPGIIKMSLQQAYNKGWTNSTMFTPIRIVNSTNMTLENLVIEEPVGTGVWLGNTSGVTNKNITVSNVRVNKGAFCGFVVEPVSVDNVVFRDCVAENIGQGADGINNTNDTILTAFLGATVSLPNSPAGWHRYDGFHIETEHGAGNDSIKGLTLLNCSAINCADIGFRFQFQGVADDANKPMSLTVEGCKVIGGAWWPASSAPNSQQGSFTFYNYNIRDLLSPYNFLGAPIGSLTVGAVTNVAVYMKNCSVSSNKAGGIQINNWARNCTVNGTNYNPGKLMVENFTVDCHTQAVYYPLYFNGSSAVSTDYEQGNVYFTNVFIYNNLQTNAFKILDSMVTASNGIKDISGSYSRKAGESNSIWVSGADMNPSEIDVSGLTNNYIVKAFDDFESGSTNGGFGWSASWYPIYNGGIVTNLVEAQDGKWLMQLTGGPDTRMTRSISLAGYTSPRLGLYVQGIGSGSTQALHISFYYGTWDTSIIPINSVNDGKWHYYEYDMPTNTTKVILKAVNLTTTDAFWIDNVQVKSK
jgi:hypothetical protein